MPIFRFIPFFSDLNTIFSVLRQKRYAVDIPYIYLRQNSFIYSFIHYPVWLAGFQAAKVMKYTKYQQMRKEAEVKAVFGKKTFTNAKRVANLDAAIINAQAYTTESATTEVLSYYKRYINTLPKDVRGDVKRAFCDAIRDVFASFDILSFIGTDGRLQPTRVFGKVRKADAPDLCQLLTNLILQDAAGSTHTVGLGRTESVPNWVQRSYRLHPRK